MQTDFTDARTVCAAFAAAKDGIYDTVVLAAPLYATRKSAELGQLQTSRASSRAPTNGRSIIREM